MTSLRTSDVNSTSSRDQLLAFLYLVTSCFIEVKNPCGLKKPVSQKDGGLSLKIQLLSWKCLSRRPLIHPASDMVNHEISAPVGSYYHFFGTLKSKTALIESTISGVMIIDPSIASIISTIVLLTIDKML